MHTYLPVLLTPGSHGSPILPRCAATSIVLDQRGRPDRAGAEPRGDPVHGLLRLAPAGGPVTKRQLGSGRRGGSQAGRTHAHQPEPGLPVEPRAFVQGARDGG